LLVLAALSLAFGGSALAQTITVGQASDPVTLDPHGQNDQPSARVRVQIYDTLVVQSEDLELVPGLAESWEQVDDTTYEFVIREGVSFHNGDPLTAADVVYSLNRLRDPETAAPAAFLVDAIESVEATSDMVVRITTEFPFAPILSHLAHGATAILSERAVTEAGDDYGTTVAVGTGPFRFVNWATASQLVLERNPDWWGGEVLPERVVFRPITEGTVRAIELETGGVDIAYTLEATDANRLRGGENPNVRLESVETLTTSYIGFNVQKEPFDDVRVRQAINHAIDVELIAEVVYTGQATRATSPTPQRVFGSNPNLEPFEYNPERARELLAEAGYENGFSTTLWTNDNPLRIQIAEIVQAELGELDISVDVQVLEWGAYLSDTAAGLHDMFILGWVTVTGDADYGLYSLFHSSQQGNPGNRTFFADDRVDELLDRGRTSLDEEERLAAYYEAQEIIQEEAPWVFLIFTTEDNGVRADIQGFVPHPAGHHRLYNVSRTQ
jgi:peptide/nickel transport system substrate-binding protein